MDGTNEEIKKMQTSLQGWKEGGKEEMKVQSIPGKMGADGQNGNKSANALMDGSHVNEWICGRENEWVDGWMNERTNERTNE